MAFAFGPTLSNYLDVRYRVILDLEEGGQVKPGVYNDAYPAPGFATIGAGFLVLDDVSWILEAMGHRPGDPALDHPTDTVADRIRRAVANKVGTRWVSKTFRTDYEAQTAIDEALRRATGLATAQFRFDFEPDGTEIVDPLVVQARIRQAFDAACTGDYETRVNDWLPNYKDTGPPAPIPGSLERIALLSLAYNGLVGVIRNSQQQIVGYKSPSLRQAILSGNRAEAWFEIRYNSSREAWNYIRNGSLKSGTAGLVKRRFEEAALFGLYNPNASQTSADEAKQIYRMFQAHRREILDYENAFGEKPIANMAVFHGRASQGNQITAARNDYHLSDLPQPLSLVSSLDPAKNALLGYIKNQYVELQNLNVDDYLSTAVFLGNPTTTNALNAVIEDQEGAEIASKDVLIGDDEADYLRGGKGDDVLIGGQGVDVYDFATGDGKDRIVEARDADGKMHGVIFIDDVLRGDLLASGVFVPTGPNTWSSLAHGNEITLTNNSPWKLVTDAGDEIELGSDFQDGDFGIDLLAAPTVPQPTLTIVGDLTPVEPEQYDILGNLVVDPNSSDPDRPDVLNGRDNETEGDLIQSKGGDDVVAAKKGDDKIEAGTGSDIVNAGEGNDLVLGGADLDLLWGLEGNDRLYADAEVDLQTAIAQGETDLPTGSKGELMDGGQGEDILVGGAGNDALVGGGGTGANVILGGAGDDLLLGHVRITSVAREWTVTRTVQQGPGGTQYLWGFTNATIEADSTPSNDALYGGQGNDWLIGGQGNDLLDGGSGEDVIFGADGADVLVGGADKDVLVGEQGEDFLSGDTGEDRLLRRGTRFPCETRNRNSPRAHKELVCSSRQSGPSRWASRKSVLTVRGGLLCSASHTGTQELAHTTTTTTPPPHHHTTIARRPKPILRTVRSWACFTFSFPVGG
jgi:Ca2+-binding RTX toxin-like protein